MSMLPLKASEAAAAQTSSDLALAPRLLLLRHGGSGSDPSRERILVKVSFVAILVGDEEKLLVLALVLSFGQVDLQSPDWTKRAIL